MPIFMASKKSESLRIVATETSQHCWSEEHISKHPFHTLRWSPRGPPHCLPWPHKWSFSFLDGLGGGHPKEKWYGPFFETMGFFWVFMTFLDIDSIHQVAKLLILAYFGPPFLVKVLQKDTSFISFIAKFAGRLEVSDMNQTWIPNPSKSQKRGGIISPKNGEIS